MATTEVNAPEQIKGILPVTAGGSGLNTIPSNAVVLGSGTSPVTTVSPGMSGNVLTDNGSTWVSSTPVVANYFAVDGGSATTSYVGTLKVDFGGAS